MANKSAATIGVSKGERARRRGVPCKGTQVPASAAVAGVVNERERARRSGRRRTLLVNQVAGKAAVVVNE